MKKITRRHITDLQGLTRLAVEATTGTTHIVEKMHHTIQLGHLPIGQSRASNTKGITGLVYKTIRGTTNLVGKGLDLGLTPIAALLPNDDLSSKNRHAMASILNGMFGDHLAHTHNPLALEMTLHAGDLNVDPHSPNQYFDLAPKVPISNKIMVFVHGLCLNDHYWEREEKNPSKELAQALGYTPIYVRYNTGLPIHENGKTLSSTLETLMENWPTQVANITLVGHSMGGLVSRSACHYAKEVQHIWPSLLTQMVFIGTPHDGAPLERSANFLDYLMDFSPYIKPFTRFNKARSAGITNLGHGCITETRKEFIQLPEDVECFALAAVLSNKRSLLEERLTGDGLVPLDSALGKSKDANRRLNIPDSHQWVGYEIGHNEMLTHPEVFHQIKTWLQH